MRGSMAVMAVECAAMELSLKPDVERVLDRYEAWWHGEVIDRPPVMLWAKPDAKGAKLPGAKEYGSLRERWMDVEYQLDRFEAMARSRTWPGDLLPTWMPNLGPEICATVFGAELEFGEHTSWSKPLVHAIGDVLRLTPNLDNDYWNWIRKATDLSLQRGGGHWITAITDLHTNGDLVASLRDPQELCLDVMDEPETVGKAMAHVTEAFALMYDDLYGRIAAAGQPSLTWSPVPHRGGRMYFVSCDFSALLGPDAFRGLIWPSIQREMAQLDRRIYHLDGPQALPHLDVLLESQALHAVQWVYGAGGGRASDWVKVYQRIQAAGKSMQIVVKDVEDMKAVMDELKPEGCHFALGGEYDPTEVAAILKMAERWAAGLVV